MGGKRSHFLASPLRCSSQLGFLQGVQCRVDSPEPNSHLSPANRSIRNGFRCEGLRLPRMTKIEQRAPLGSFGMLGEQETGHKLGANGSHWLAFLSLKLGGA